MSQNAVLTQLARSSLTPEIKLERQLEELIATSAGTLKVERVSIWLLDESRRRLSCSTMFTHSTGEISRGLTLDIENAPNYFATLYEGRGFAADNAQADARTQEFADSYLKPLGITSMMDVPLRVGGTLAGVICHEHVGPARKWAPDEQNFAASIGDLASLMIESDKRNTAERALQEAYQALELKVQARTEELAQGKRKATPARSAEVHVHCLNVARAAHPAQLHHRLYRRGTAGHFRAAVGQATRPSWTRIRLCQTPACPDHRRDRHL